mmetsp:Transcript_325/g.681  ORF Transcript_325/g.681 Transcript_325/m.681 type:complete len:467 (+) Transcript_325:104-1504(+)
MIFTALDNFYLSDEQLTNPPSVAEGGIDLETEFKLRAYGAELIQEGGILLKSPQAVMATGQVLLHRFYCKKSFTKYPVKRVASACLWLATKLEESPRKLRDVLNVSLRMECRRENLPVELLDYFSKRYDHLKGDIIRHERLLLREFGFIVHVEHPHKFVLNYLQMMGMQHLMQEAWSLVNDSLRSPLCVRFNAEVVACGVIYLAARRKEVSLPEEPPWWTLFGVNKNDMDEVCRMICGLYTMPKLTYIHVVNSEKPLSHCNYVDHEKNLAKEKMRQAREKAELLKEARKESDTPISDSPAAYSQGGTTALQASDMKSPIDSSSQKATPTPASDTPASRPESQSQADTADAKSEGAEVSKAPRGRSKEQRSSSPELRERERVRGDKDPKERSSGREKERGKERARSSHKVDRSRSRSRSRDVARRDKDKRDREKEASRRNRDRPDRDRDGKRRDRDNRDRRSPDRRR